MLEHACIIFDVEISVEAFARSSCQGGTQVLARFIGSNQS